MKCYNDLHDWTELNQELLSQIIFDNIDITTLKYVLNYTVSQSGVIFP